jgi:hypothetical protein
VAVEVFPRSTPDHEVVAYQEISGKFSLPSGHVDIEFADNIPSPVVIPPVRFGDTEVWCDNLLVGAHLRLFNRQIVGISRIDVQTGGGAACVASSAARHPADCPRHDGRWR